jgi:flavin-dependent dehydrogenase
MSKPSFVITACVFTFKSSKKPTNMTIRTQATVEGEFDSGAVELWFGSDVSPDFFGWLVPLSSTKARIGLAAKDKTLDYFKRFSEKRIGKAIRPDIGGLINFGLMNNTTAERVLVVGDAACQVKPFSGGGVIYSLIGAGYCANACIRALQKNDFSAGFLKREYDEKWKWQLEKPIKRGLLYRRVLLGSDKRMNLLFKIGKYAKFVLESFDMDLL